MTDIDKVKGVVIEPSGTVHTFGHCLMIPKEIETTHEKHQQCFEEEILDSDWWKNSNINYDYDHYYYSQVGELTKQGLSLIQNGSTVTDRGNRSISYMVALSSEGLTNQEEYVKDVYSKIDEIINKEDSAYFELSLFKDGLPIVDMLADSVESLDEFYNEIGIDINQTKSNKK